MRTLVVKKITLAILLSSTALTSVAAGLGRLDVLSGLGEPFRAEIELISTTTEELETLSAVIASDEAYNAQGITRLGIHNDIKVTLSTAGSPKLILASSQAVSDPYLDMLIQLDWASGRLQREYTVLLDPPEYQAAVAQESASSSALIPKQENVELPKPVISEPISKVEIIQPEPTPVAPANPIESEELSVIKSMSDAQSDFPSVGQKSEAEIQAEINRIESQAKSQFSQDVTIESAPTITTSTQQVTATYTPTSSQLRTRSGDNLSKIARRLQVSGVTLNQMLVGLYEYNKDAFVNGNMNRLKVGKVIKLPTKEELLSISRRQASQTVSVHTQNWQSYRQAVAGNVSSSVSVEDQKQAESGEITAFEPDAPIKPTETKDVVKLSATDKDDKSLNNDDVVVDTGAEEDIAKDKALQEAQDRTAAVEKQIEDMQKLLKMKNDEMAALEEKAAENNESLPAEDIPAENADQPEIVELSPAPESDLPAQEVPVVEEPAKSEEPSWWEKITDVVNLPILGGLGAVLMLLLGLLFLRNKRKKDLENFERGILTSGGLRANTVFGNTTGDTSSADTSFLTDFAQTTDGAMMDTNEVDPIAEAEVYMAYGREAQAEEILKEAIKKEPKRHELQLKLLEIYQDRKDNAAFETLASEMYTTLGDEDPTWLKVSEMGRVLEPANPLYTNEAQPSVVNELPADMDSADESAEDDISLSESSIDFEDRIEEIKDNVYTKVAGAAGLVGSAVSATGSRIESIVKHEPTPEVENDDLPDLDVDLGAQQEGAKSSYSSFGDMTLETMTSDESESDLSLDTNAEITSSNEVKDFDLSGISLEIEEDTQQANDDELDVDDDIDVPDITLEDYSMDSDTILAAAEGEGLDDNEVEIKLNLVSAYIDMDDKEGAKELLEEVIKEGNEEQVMRAQMMKDSLS